MPRIAYLTGPTYRGVALAAGDVPTLERTGLDLTRTAGEAFGLSFDVVNWDDSALPGKGYDLAIIRSCWDYHRRPDEFVATLEAHERAGLQIYNSSKVVRWNARKTYLRELGRSAIETLWPEHADAETIARAFDELGSEEIIVKPQFGAGSIETVRLKRGAWREEDLAGAPRGPAMIQAFLPSIETEGERSLFWFGGTYSHAIRKVPKPGDWRANVPNETRFIADPPPRAALEAAESARERAPQDLLYVRIDLVLGADGAWRVIEIEAIEPYLFLDFAPDRGALFAGAIARVLG